MLFNMQVTFQGVWERGVTVIETAEVRAVDRGARKNTSRNGREHVTRMRKRVGIRWMQGDDFVAAGRLGNDSEGATDLIGELGDTVELGAALDLDANKDKIANGEAGSRATGVDAITVSMAAIFDDEGDDFAGEIDVLACMLDVL